MMDDVVVEKGGWEKHHVGGFEITFEINDEVATFSISGDGSLKSEDINGFSEEFQKLIVKYTRGE